MLSTSFKVRAEIRSVRPTLLPMQWTTANYRDLLMVFPMLRHLFNSLFYASGVTNAVDEADYRQAQKDVRALGLSPRKITHRRPAAKK